MGVNREQLNKNISNATWIFRIFGLQYFTLRNDKKENKVDKKQAIETKYKIIFVINLVFVAILAAILRTFEVWQSLIIFEKLSPFIFGCVLAFSMVHAIIKTPKARKIFEHCEEIVRIFEENQAFDCHYDEFGRAYKKVSFLLSSILSCLCVALTIFTYFYQYKRFLYVFFIKFIGHIIIVVNILRFIFLIMLIRHNVKLIKYSLDNLNYTDNLVKMREAGIALIMPTKNFKNFEIQSSIVKIRKAYNHILEMTDLCNEISGPAICFIIILGILGNAVSGFKLFLVIKHLVTIEKFAGKHQALTLDLNFDVKIFFLRTFYNDDPNIRATLLYCLLLQLYILDRNILLHDVNLLLN